MDEAEKAFIRACFYFPFCSKHNFFGFSSFLYQNKIFRNFGVN